MPRLLDIHFSICCYRFDCAPRGCAFVISNQQHWSLIENRIELKNLIVRKTFISLCWLIAVFYPYCAFFIISLAGPRDISAYEITGEFVHSTLEEFLWAFPHTNENFLLISVQIYPLGDSVHVIKNPEYYGIHVFFLAFASFFPLSLGEIELKHVTEYYKTWY